MGFNDSLDNSILCFEDESLLSTFQSTHSNLAPRCLSFSDFVKKLNPFEEVSPEQTEFELKNILDEKAFELRNHYLKTFEFIQKSKTVHEEGIDHFFSLIETNEKNRKLKTFYLKYLKSPLSKNFAEKALELIEKIEPASQHNSQNIFFIKGSLPSVLFLDFYQKISSSNIFEKASLKDIWELFPIKQKSFYFHSNPETALKKIVQYFERKKSGTLFFAGSTQERFYLELCLKSKKIPLEAITMAPLLGYQTSNSLAYIGNAFEESSLKEILLTDKELEKIKSNGIEVWTYFSESERKKEILNHLPKTISTLELPFKKTFSIKPSIEQNYPIEDFSKQSLPLKHLSASQLELYQTCPTKYLFNKLRLSPSNTETLDYFALNLGKSTHEAFEKFIRNNSKDFSLLPALFRESLLANVPKLASNNSLLIAYEEQFKNFIPAFTFLESQLTELFGNYTNKGLEVPFEIQVESIPIKGVIDRVLLTENNEVVLLDYKTGEVGFSPSHISKGEHFQSLIYLLASEQIFKEPCLGFLFYDLKKSELRKGILFEEKITTLQKKYITRGHSQTAAGWNEIKIIGTEHIKIIYNKIKTSQFLPNPSYSNCGRCSFKGLCRSAYGSE